MPIKFRFFECNSVMIDHEAQALTHSTWQSRVSAQLPVMIRSRRRATGDNVPSLTEVTQTRDNESLLIKTLVNPASDLHTCQYAM